MKNLANWLFKVPFYGPRLGDTLSPKPALDSVHNLIFQRFLYPLKPCEHLKSATYIFKYELAAQLQCAANICKVYKWQNRMCNKSCNVHLSSISRLQSDTGGGGGTTAWGYAPLFPPSLNLHCTHWFLLIPYTARVMLIWNKYLKAKKQQQQQ